MSSAMASLVGPEVRITPEDVRPGGDAEWLGAARAFIERAAARGASVRLVAEEESLSPAQAAALLNVSRSTIRRAILAGEVEAFKRGSHHRVPVSEVGRLGRRLRRETAEFFADDEF
jgi:excisionase family DNA binding protein